jgi:hypothetical protein
VPTLSPNSDDANSSPGSDSRTSENPLTKASHSHSQQKTLAAPNGPSWATKAGTSFMEPASVNPGPSYDTSRYKPHSDGVVGEGNILALEVEGAAVPNQSPGVFESATMSTKVGIDRIPGGLQTRSTTTAKHQSGLSSAEKREKEFTALLKGEQHGPGTLRNV